ncbi:MAG: hypothetical protein U0S49_16135, partial [Rhodospirillales bacterium]|nr:hypothetical protein [Rhodospirillales bacterium]
LCCSRVVGVHMTLSKPASTTVWNHIWTRPSTPNPVSRRPLRREELCLLKVKDVTQRRGVAHLRIHGKGSKIRYLPLHPGTA